MAILFGGTVYYFQNLGSKLHVIWIFGYVLRTGTTIASVLSPEADLAERGQIGHDLPF